MEEDKNKAKVRVPVWTLDEFQDLDVFATSSSIAGKDC